MAGLIVGRNYRLKPPIVAPRPATSQNGRRSAKFIAWKPQIIVVALGTNDFSTQLNPGERWKTRGELHSDYEKTSARFIQSLRAGNPDA
jgi:lysophospholipase L1-like esterase